VSKFAVSDLVNSVRDVRKVLAQPFTGATEDEVRAGRGKIARAYDVVDQLIIEQGLDLPLSIRTRATVTRIHG
jgi:hypothetical protein